MVRSHWLALAACPALLILTVAPFGCSSDASEDGSTRAADAGPTEDADVPDVAETPEDTNAAGGLTATAIDFGDVNCGTAAPAQTFAITNPSTTGYIRFTATLDEGGDSPFVLSPSTGRIGPGERQIVTVTPSIVPVGPDAEHPTPTGKNGRGDHVTIVAGTSGLTGAFGVDLLQTARGAVLAFASPGIDFMNSPLAAGTVSQSFGVRNTGNVDATVGLTLTGDDVFGLGAPSVVTSAGGQPATALATFKPTAEQAYSGAVAMSVGADVALCAALPAEAFTLTGAGVGSVVGLSTTALLFGVTDCGTIAAPQTVTVTNYGASSFKITSLRLTKGNDVVYDTPTASPAITTPVAPNGGATSITIAPREISSTSGSVDDNFYGDTLTITTDVVGDTPHTVDLRQSARGVIITRAPVGTVTFGDIGRGNTGKRQVTYANVGNVDVTFNVTHPSPHFTAPAQISIGKGSSATATLVFTPPTDATVNTGYTDSLTFARTDTKVPICQTIATTPLHGSGIRPVTTVFPTGTQAYGSVNCGTTPGTKTLTYTNNGPAIHWTAAFATGTQYTVSPASGDLAAGGSVDLTVTPNAVPTIRVLNPRARNRVKFAEIVTNVSKVGLKKPITVCTRPGSGGEYDLVCGQGRLEALAKLGQTHVPALVVEATPEDRYIMSLVENIARRQPDSLELVRSIAALEDRGYTPAQIAEKVGVTEKYVRGLLRLHAKGEELLLAAVERGDLPIHVAVEIATAKDGDVRKCLAEAYERGDLKGKAVSRARALVERRLANGKRTRGGKGPRTAQKRLSADELVRAYKRSTQKQALLVKRAQVCESMLRIVGSALRELIQDDHFVTLLRAEKLDKMPKYLAEQMKLRGAS